MNSTEARLGTVAVRAKCRFWKGSRILPDLARDLVMYSQIRTDAIFVAICGLFSQKAQNEVRYVYLFRE